ncbi:MAG: DUF4179 domain-containing protein [Clostridiales bacterium]|nr:DUF4179 domain-containing protein [Clostridiales bacterium]
MNNKYDNFERYIEEKFSKLKNEFESPKRLNSKGILLKEKYNYKCKMGRKICFVCCILAILCIGYKPVIAGVIDKIFKEDSIDEGVIDAEVNNKITPLDNIMESQGIKVNLNGVVADSERIVLSVSFQSSDVNFNDLSLDGVSLKDETGRAYELYHYGQGELNKNMNTFNTTLEFKGSPEQTSELTLQLKSINNIKGDWESKFNVSTIPSEEFIIKQQFNSDNVDLQIDKIKLTATNTIIEGNMIIKDFNY